MSMTNFFVEEKKLLVVTELVVSETVYMDMCVFYSSPISFTFASSRCVKEPLTGLYSPNPLSHQVSSTC